MEWNDIYDEHRHRTGRLHLRGTPWNPGERGLTVCVWVGNGRGAFLLTRRAKEKSYAGTWENSGGAVTAGETSLEGICRELREETGISATAEEFVLLSQDDDDSMYYDHYYVRKDVPLSEIRLLPGETDAACWASPEKIRSLIATGEICDVIGTQYLRMEGELLERNGK